DLLYRQRGYPLALLFIAGFLVPLLVGWSEARAGQGVGSLPLGLVILFFSTPMLVMAMSAPLMGIRFWAADWPQRPAPYLLPPPPSTHSRRVRGPGGGRSCR